MAPFVIIVLLSSPKSAGGSFLSWSSAAPVKLGTSEGLGKSDASPSSPGSSTVGREEKRAGGGGRGG